MAIRIPKAVRVAALIGSVLLAFCQPVWAVRVSAEIPVDSPTRFVIQPGESTTFSIDFTNLDNEAGTGQGWAHSLLVGLGESWLVEPLAPATCWFPIPHEGLRLEFPVELLAGENRRCTYTVTRASATYRDSYLEICTGEEPAGCNQRQLLVFGTLPDVGVTVTPTSQPVPGATDLTFRIDVSNAAAVPTAESPLYTGCRETAGGNPAANLPFQLETGFAGACPAATIRSCSIDPPVLFFSWEVTIPSVPPNGTTSCLVRMRLREPLNTPIHDRLASWMTYPFYPGHPIPLIHPGTWPGAGQGFDMNPGNNVADFSVVPLAQPAEPVPVGRWVLVMLTLVLAALAWRRLGLGVREATR